MHYFFSKKYLLPFAVLFIFQMDMTAQISISESGIDPDASAILDLQSTDKGILIPRMDSTGRLAIINPAEGLMVYDSTTHSFWFYQNSDWTELGASPIPTGAVAGQFLSTDGGDSLYWNDFTEGQTLTLDGDLLSITSGDTVDLSGLRNISYSGLTLITDEVQYNLDVQQTSSSGSYGQTTSIWQSFKPTETGYLSQLDIRFYPSPNFNSGSLSFYSGEGTGGELLASFPVDSIAGGWFSFDLSDNVVPMDADSTYTFSFIASSGSFYMYQNSTNPYPDGRASTGSTKDFLFKTYYSPYIPYDTSQVLYFNTLTTDSASFNMQYIDTLFFSDGSIQTIGNDWQTIDQFSLSNDTLYLSLENDGQDALSVDLSGLSKNLLEDADADTKIQVEESADEDIIRFDVAGSQAMVIESNGYVGVGTEPTDRFQVDIGLSSTSTLSSSNTSGSSYPTITTSSWQSYTATVSGEMEKVVLRSYYGTGTRTISIYEGEGTSGALLGTSAVVLSGAFEWVEVSITNVTQVAGQQYTIAFDNRERFIFSDSNPYSEGISGNSSDYDYQFKVYVFSTALFSVGENGVVVGGYELPTEDGLNGQALITDGSGNASWTDLTDEQTLSISGDSLTISNGNSVDLSNLSPSQLSDSDSDTKIQVEESADEDIIRFDVAGSQAMVIESNGYVGVGTEPTDRFQVVTGLGSTSTLSASNTSGGSYPTITTSSWQSYTATVSGEMEKVALKSYFGTGTRTISIYEGEGTSGAFLGTSAVVLSGANDWVEVSIANVTQIAGQQYTIAFDNRERFLNSTTNPYSGGRSGINSEYDFQFKVYVFSNTLFSAGENGVWVGGYYMPTSDGTNGQALVTDGSGNVSWGLPSDNLGDHTATQNIQLNGNWLSNDGGNEGISIDDSGNLSVVGDIVLTEPVLDMGLVTELPSTTPILDLCLNALTPTVESATIGAAFRMDSRSTSSAPLFQWIVKPEGSSTITSSNIKMTLNENGQLGIGRTATTNQLEVEGTASKASAGDWLANSDARLKKNIQPLDPQATLRQLLDLRGVTYEWDDNKTGTQRPEGIQFGFTAQNIQTVFPTLVSKDAKGFLQTAYGTYDAMYVEAFRALNDRVEQLEIENEKLKTEVGKINQLEQQNAEMKAMLENIQAQLNNNR
ncbi:MAG: tail fiber domain-containing protein [Saprospiraceae bacterium]